MVIHIGRLTEAFEVKSGNKQGCMLSPFLFLLVINWITKQSMDSKGTGVMDLWKMPRGLGLCR